MIEEHRSVLEKSGELSALRAEQQGSWMWSLITDRLERAFRNNPRVAAKLASVEADVLAGRKTPPAATDELFEAFDPGKIARSTA
jgi:LAO/AO transport system kinase